MLKNNDLIAIEREYCSRSLVNFTKRAWHVLEPSQPYVHGWHIEAIAEHLEAVTRGELIRLYIAVPPGCMKSLTVGVLWPAWEWGPAGLPGNRFLGTSHSSEFATRDNLRCKRLIESEWYQKLWGNEVKLTGDQSAKTKFENTKTGFRQAMAFTGMTGGRGDRVALDDVMSVDDAASDKKREAIITTFLEALPTRVNNPDKSAIVNIQQRLHERDTIGVSISKDLGYEGLVLPMEFEADNRCVTSIGFKDPRTKEGELLFPERFPREVVDRDKKTLGSYAVAAQFQQRPAPREGGIFKRDWFEIVPEAPIGVQWVRGWDLAASEDRDAAYTAGVKLGRGQDGTFYVGHVVRGQLSASGVEKLIVNTASQDPPGCIIDCPQDPGQAGKAQVRYLASKLAGYIVHFGTETGSKLQRAEPVSAQAEVGNIKLIKGDWNEAFLDEIQMFPNGSFKDQVDALSRAFNRLIKMSQSNNDEFAAPIIL